MKTIEVDFSHNGHCESKPDKTPLRTHPDYLKNAQWFKQYFLNRVDKLLYTFRPSDLGKNNLASISYRSPKGPDYCNMIVLHQNHDDFKKEIELMYKKYLKIIQNDCNPNR